MRKNVSQNRRFDTKMSGIRNSEGKKKSGFSCRVTLMRQLIGISVSVFSSFSPPQVEVENACRTRLCTCVSVTFC